MTAQWTLHGLVVFGMDGSRIDLPRTKSHEQASAPSRTPSRRTKTARGKRRAPSRQKHASHPQLWLTTLFHVSLHLPWNWRIGPADSSERSHVLDMLETLPDASLLLGDAGFVGYDFARTRSIYAVFAAVHAWLELPILALAAGVLPRHATAMARAA